MLILPQSSFARISPYKSVNLTAYWLDEEVKALYDYYVSSGTWDAKAYPPPPYYYPQGIERPSTLYNLTGALLAHGYSKDDVAKLMGGNWMRVMKQVWDDPKAEEVQNKESEFIEQ